MAYAFRRRRAQNYLDAKESLQAANTVQLKVEKAIGKIESMEDARTDLYELSTMILNLECKVPTRVNALFSDIGELAMAVAQDMEFIQRKIRVADNRAFRQLKEMSATLKKICQSDFIALSGAQDLLTVVYTYADLLFNEPKNSKSKGNNGNAMVTPNSTIIVLKGNISGLKSYIKGCKKEIAEINCLALLENMEKILVTLENCLPMQLFPKEMADATSKLKKIDDGIDQILSTYYTPLQKNKGKKEERKKPEKMRKKNKTNHGFA